MEARLIFAGFVVFIVLVFLAGVLLEKRRANGAHKRWLRNLGKQPIDNQYEQVIKNHEAFLDRVRKKP